MNRPDTSSARLATIVTLIVAGEMIFALPFHTARYFRVTLLDAFGFTNTLLGDLFAAYGVVAFLSYFPGGALADRFPARGLLTASLLATAAGGVVMATVPGAAGMGVVYAFWGFSTILLFWGALIRATREWGGTGTQGTAFGLLEGGRGLVAALAALLMAHIFAASMPEVVETATDAERRAALSRVILAYSALTALTGVAAWLLIPRGHGPGESGASPLAGMRAVLSRPVVWAQAGVVACAYCGFKGLDNYALYVNEVLGMDEVEAAFFSTWGAFLRPVAAIAAGLLADRYSAKSAISGAFLAMLAACGALSLFAPAAQPVWAIVAMLFVSYGGVFALRGVYFALLEENETPRRVTGAAVGLVSLVGFTPEIFFAPITGRILDANPGLTGFQHYFLFLAAVAAAGLLLTATVVYLHRPGAPPLWPRPANAMHGASVAPNSARIRARGEGSGDSR